MTLFTGVSEFSLLMPITGLYCHTMLACAEPSVTPQLGLHHCHAFSFLSASSLTIGLSAVTFCCQSSCLPLPALFRIIPGLHIVKHQDTSSGQGHLYIVCVCACVCKTNWNTCPEASILNIPGTQCLKQYCP